MRAVISVGLAIAAMAVGAAFYPGSLSIYLLFSLVFFAILYSGVGLSFQYSHFFIAIAWFIGFWLKLVVHYIFGHLGLNAAQYVEPTGSFDGSPGSWDAVLLTASIGGLGYLCGRLVLVPLIRTQSSTETRLDAPSWYARFRNRIWISAAVILVAIVVTNQETGLIVRGYVPRIQLPWPLGGLFAWTTDIGFALALSVLAAWDRTAGAGLARGFLALCIEGAVLSIATNSRGLYLFHTLPAVVSEARRAVFVRSRVLAAGGFAVIWLVGAVTIPLITTGLRGFGDQAVLAKVEANAVEIQSKPSVEPSVAPAPATTNGAHRGEVLGAFVRYSLEGSSRLIIDRWIGLEGVMAVVSYPERGPLLFKEAALQRRTYGMIDVYTGKVSGTQRPIIAPPSQGRSPSSIILDRFPSFSAA